MWLWQQKLDRCTFPELWVAGCLSGLTMTNAVRLPLGLSAPYPQNTSETTQVLKPWPHSDPGEDLVPANEITGQGASLPPPPNNGRWSKLTPSDLSSSQLLGSDSPDAEGCAPVTGWERVGPPSTSKTEPDLWFSITSCCFGEQHANTSFQCGKEKEIFVEFLFWGRRCVKHVLLSNLYFIARNLWLRVQRKAPVY